MVYSMQDYNRIVWDEWFKLVKKCEFSKGLDPESSGHMLCSDPNNSGTVSQVRGCKRCNIMCCPDGASVKHGVHQRLEDVAETREKNRLAEEANREKPIYQKGNVIDLTEFEATVS